MALGGITARQKLALAAQFLLLDAVNNGGDYRITGLPRDDLFFYSWHQQLLEISVLHLKFSTYKRVNIVYGRVTKCKFDISR